MSTFNAINVSLQRLHAAHRDSFAFTHTKIRCVYILGALAKLQKATVSFVVSVCLSVHPSGRPSVRMGQLGCLWTDFDEI
jgi:hypothetical protein